MFQRMSGADSFRIGGGIKLDGQHRLHRTSRPPISFRIPRTAPPSPRWQRPANKPRSFTVTGLNPNTPYTFRIIGSNGSGSSNPSNTASATTTNQTGPTPNAPVGLGATPAGPAQVFLTWVNTASNETNFVLTRATDSNFTQNVVTQTLPAAPFYYTDTAAGLSTGGAYFYKIRATNSSGSSASSNVASVTIPVVPPQPTNATAVLNGNQMTVSWTDHAGPFALGYQIFRAVDGGTYSLYANVPETSDAPPTTITFSDTNIPPGHFYSYEIEAHNISGFSARQLRPASALGRLSYLWTPRAICLTPPVLASRTD